MTIMNDKELELVNGGKNLLSKLENFLNQEFDIFGKNNNNEEGHKCLVYPKMDADNRPAITSPPFHPTSQQA